MHQSARTDCRGCQARNAVRRLNGLCERCYRARPELRVRKRSFRPWTRAEEQRLRELCGQNLTYAQIARRLGRPVNQVLARRGRLGLKKGHVWLADPRKVRELVGEGLSDPEVARELSIADPTWVWRARQRLGLPANYRGGNSKELVAHRKQKERLAALNRWPNCHATKEEARVLDALEALGGEALLSALLAELGGPCAGRKARHTLAARGLIEHFRVRGPGSSWLTVCRLSGAAKEALKRKMEANDLS